MLKPGTILKTESDELVMVIAGETTKNAGTDVVECVRCEGSFAGTRCFIFATAHHVGHIRELEAAADRWSKLTSLLKW